MLADWGCAMPGFAAQGDKWGDLLEGEASL